MASRLIVTTGEQIAGARVTQHLGVVRGLAVRVPNISQGLEALGGLLRGNQQASAEMYAEICERTRAEAYDRLLEHAGDLGADAIIAMRYESTDIGEAATEVLAYGTAVKLSFTDVLPA